MFSPSVQIGGLFFLSLQFVPAHSTRPLMNWQVLNTPRCELGESPFWHPGEQRLYWVDIPKCQLYRFKPASGAVEHWTVPSEPGCIAPMQSPAGGLVMALRNGIYRAAQWGGPLELLAPAQHDVANFRFNDGKADPMGRFWAGTVNERRDAATAHLYCLATRPGNEHVAAPVLQAQMGGATVANGLAWSPDARTLYWADTSSHTVRAWQWDAVRNLLTGERVFGHWPEKPPLWVAGAAANPPYAGRPDGAAVDIEGNYYIAMYEGAQVLKLSPAGVVLDCLPLPAQCPTMPCFGGPDL
ncbi:MAG: SMP-30/gluconolactonase/LRE family protein, partial [Polaromonas sp.]|nr:SMP-30/gluconolactonase/LRE family protein [Polaromonas sp.]